MRRSPRQLGFLLVALAVWASSPASHALDRQLHIAPAGPAPGGEKRIALVIGNSAYKASPLRNPVNDARAISKALAATGFRVTVVEDASRALMWRAIREFGDELLRGGVGLFYYAGHGMQVHGKNYLIPVNADIQREDEIEFQAIDANIVLSKMDSAKNSLNLMILDACRNNPFARAFRSASRGLAQMDAPSGTLVAFATAPGSVASDGDGDNGLYTKHLLANIAKPGLPIEQVFKEVRRGVGRETGDRQVPWESSSLTGDFYFVASAPSTGEAQKQQVAAAVADALRDEKEKLAAQRHEMERMIKETLARQRQALEEERRANAAAPAQVASSAPSTAASAAALPGLAKVGDRWEYGHVQLTTKIRRRIDIEVSAVSAEAIDEVSRVEGRQPGYQRHASSARLSSNQLWLELSPYLFSQDAPKEGFSWTSLPVERVELCQRITINCHFEGKVIGREKVQTPAGTFDAVKISVDHIAHDANTYPNYTSARRITYWFAGAARRVVKVSARTLHGTTLEDDYDVELVSYKLN